MAEKYHVVLEDISPRDNATDFIIITTEKSVSEVMDLPPSNIEVLEAMLTDSPHQLAQKINVISLLGWDIREWWNKKISLGVSPLYTALFITSRLANNQLSRYILNKVRIQKIPQKEELC